MNSSPARWHAWLGAIVIFLLGLTVGVLGTVVVGVRAVRRNLLTPPTAPGFADRAAGRIARQLADELQLTPDQAERVRADFAQAAANIRAVRGRALREVRQEVWAAVVRAGQDLPPDKREQYRARMRKRFARAGFGELEPPAGN